MSYAPVDRTEGSTITVGHFVRLLGRRRTSLLITIAICLALAGAGFALASRTYQAQAVIDVTPDAASGVDPKTVSVQTEQSVLTSTQVAAVAKKTLHSQDSPDTLLKNLSVTSPLNSLVLDVVYTAPTAREAADGANAFANGYVSYRQDVNNRRTSARLAALTDSIDQLTAKVDALASSSEHRAALQGEIQSLQQQYNSVKFAVSDTGQVIGVATPPDSPSSPKLLIYGAGGVVLGLVLGVIVALVRDRRDDSVRSVDDIESAVGAPTLAVLPFSPRPRRRVAPLATVSQPLGSEADAFRTLALKLVRPSSRPGRPTARTGEAARRPTALVIALVGVDQSGHSPLDLAVVLSRQRVRTALVGTAQATAAARSLLRQESSSELPNLALVSVGDEIDLDGLLRSEDSPLSDAIEQAEVVLLDGVSVEHASSALSLAQYAHGCVVFATVGATSKAALRSLAQELAQIDAPLSGTAMLYRARRGTGPSSPSLTSTGTKATQNGRPIIDADDDDNDNEPKQQEQPAGDSPRSRVDRALRRDDDAATPSTGKRPSTSNSTSKPTSTSTSKPARGNAERSRRTDSPTEPRGSRR